LGSGRFEWEQPFEHPIPLRGDACKLQQTCSTECQQINRLVEGCDTEMQDLMAAIGREQL
jgi:hypothetical protein